MTGNAAFRVHLNEPMQRAGLGGNFARVAATHDGLTITGESAGSLRLPWSTLHRARVGFTETTYGLVYEALLSPAGEPAVRLLPYDHSDLAGYADAMRMLTRELSANGRAARIELGISKFEALFAPVLVGIVAAMAVFIAAFAMHPPRWWHVIVIPGIPAIAWAILTWRAVHVHWPRALAAMSDLERQLPH